MPSCKKGDETIVPSSDGLITKIIAHDQLSPTTYDTALISYNTDSTIHQIVNSMNNDGSVTFYYSTGLIKRVTSYASTSETIVDSIIVGTDGVPIASYEILNAHPEMNTEQHYSYNTNGELAQTLITYPSISPIPLDTINYTWVDGDLVSQVSTTGQYDINYTYDTNKPCQPGDPLYLMHLTETGLRRLPNTHLCIAMEAGGDPAQYSYTYDASNRINQLIVTQGQDSDTSYFGYSQ
ncbi:MAG: hypothetical protein JST06_09425 [Bacteroidetes bacterium]|nr:hypothetical protein [Bacteroidota bacterium]MBS1629114.1 hypothetical protein [Bacteroidota bacterium]